MILLSHLIQYQFKKVEKFFETMPKLTHTVKVINPNTKVESEITIEGPVEFFRISMAHEDLVSYYKLNFALMQHHKYGFDRIRKHDSLGKRKFMFHSYNNMLKRKI